MTASDSLIKARAALERAAILYVIDAMHQGLSMNRAITDAAHAAGVSPEWLVARVATFRRGHQRPVIVAALNAAGLLPVIT